MKAWMVPVVLMCAMQAMAAPRTVYGPVNGPPDCAEWMSVKETGGEQLQIYRSWFIGFVSGINFGSSDNLLINLSANGAIYWAEKDCADHPLDNSSKAGIELIRELKAKRGIK